jgi:hypothetical protein
MAWSYAQRRAHNERRKREQELCAVPSRSAARRDTLRYFRVVLAKPHPQGEERCDACEKPASVSDGFMLICRECALIVGVP